MRAAGVNPGVRRLGNQQCMDRREVSPSVSGARQQIFLYFILSGPGAFWLGVPTVRSDLANSCPCAGNHPHLALINPLGLS